MDVIFTNAPLPCKGRQAAKLNYPQHGTIRYNGLDIRGLHSDIVNEIRGLDLSRHLTFFDAVLLASLTLGRTNLSAEDLLWALDLVSL